jgi:putative flippase GtrA
LVNLLIGKKITDTQTGLRGIPASLLPRLLQLRSSGYEFELDMLITCKHQSCPVMEEPIRTIYLDGNKSSHFHPLLDSMRIYFVLFRFSMMSLMTAIVDNVVFMLMMSLTDSVARSQVAGRLVGLLFNYVAVRRAVFHSQQNHLAVLPKYLLLVACNGVISYAAIQFLHSRFGFRIVTAKLLAEGVLFIANFAIQRDFVFTRRPPS